MCAPNTPSKLLVFLCAALACFGAATVAAQGGQGSAGAGAAKDDETIMLSPFEVRSDEDVGYQASNTTSGSRMNTSLKDTAAPISAFTPEFLADIGATGLGDMMAYATNSEPEFEDATNGFNNAGARLAAGNDTNFRLRGLVAGASVDYVTSSIPVDLYNIERAEVSNGPNSVLFGLGDAGGNVALTTKRANARKTKLSFSNVIGSWDYERATFDGNVAVKPGLVGLRLMGVYQNSNYWRDWVFDDQHRLSGSLVLEPFKTTTIRASFERGKKSNSAVINWNAQDFLTAWLDAGSPVADAAALAGTTRFNANARYTFVENDRTVYNYRQELQSASRYGAGVQTLVPPSMMPYNVNPVGPGGIRTQDFDSQSVVVEQRVGGYTFELGYYRNTDYIIANSTDGLANLYGDPNATIPPASFVGAVPNPRAGQLYLEQRWGHDRVWDKNDVVRLTGAKEVDLGKWFGRHRVAGMFEHSKRERTHYFKTEIFVDENNVPITAAGTPEGPQNGVFRRNYVTPGDFTTYYMGNGLIPVPDITLNGRTYHVREVSKTKANDRSLQSINSYMIATQSYWWRDRFITTLGYRLDDLGFRTAEETRLSDPNDPRVRDGSHVLNEWEFSNAFQKHDYTPYTFTAGAVLHVTKRVSLFANTSTNRSSPRFARSILPNGDVPPPVKGESKDFGFMLDLLGDNRVFLRVTRFDTRQLDDAPIVPDSVNTETSAQLGGDNLLNIYNALLSAHAITQAQYDAEVVTYTAGMADVYSRGVEAELVANPTDAISLRLGYSHSNRNRVNVFKEIFAYYAAKTPEWRALAAGNAALTDTINTELATISEKLNDQLDLQTGPLGSRPDKLNFTGRYQFRYGRLKGLTVGGGIRYQSPQYMSYNRSTDTAVRGNETLFGDAFVSYRRRAPWWGGSMLFQLNVRNLTNDYLIEVGRRNDTGSGIRRVYLNEPRNIRFTVTLDF